MFEKNEVIEVEIESLVYGGDGLARKDGMVIFVPDSVPGDKIDIKITNLKKDYARGEIIHIIEPSPHRIEPICPLTECGGCQWQHIDYQEQLSAKKKIMEESFRRIANLDVSVDDVIGSDQPLGYRSKIQLPVQIDKESGQIIIGYYQKGTHLSVDMKECPIHPDIVNRVTNFIKEKANDLRLTAYSKKSENGLVRHIVYRYSSSHNKLLVIFVLNHGSIPKKIRSIAESIQENFPDVDGVLVNSNMMKGGVIMGDKSRAICGKDYLMEDLEGRSFKISADSFFQVNPGMAVKMFEFVHRIIANRTLHPTVLDLYAGVGTFTQWLEGIAHNVLGVEESLSAVNDAMEQIKQLKVEERIKVIKHDAELYLETLMKKNQYYDVIILDPPRKGCSPRALELISKLAKLYIAYVSCDPVVLAKESDFLIKAGFKLELVQPFDMFSQTYHVESVALFKRI